MHLCHSTLLNSRYLFVVYGAVHMCVRLGNTHGDGTKDG